MASTPGPALCFLLLSNVFFSLAGETVPFAMLYKWFPNVQIGWTDAWVAH